MDCQRKFGAAAGLGDTAMRSQIFWLSVIADLHIIYSEVVS
jgi:hypothetical protein